MGRALALRPSILVLNDPARGIDVEAKRELYDHLREFATHGHSVVFMSSELEVFFGLCSRVVVFRHGSIFDSLVGDEIDPVRIFEAMFGQMAGLAARRRNGATTNHQTPASNGPDTAAPPQVRKMLAAPQLPKNVRDIRIVDFDQKNEKQTKTVAPAKGGSLGKRIKVVYFDD